MGLALFERLRLGEGKTGRQGRSSERQVEETLLSVCANLERILNSRAGMAAACPRYGLPDFVEIVRGIPQRARELEDELKRCIVRYEPRVTDVSVEHVEHPDQPLSACFRIRAALVAGKSGEEVWFETVVERSGRVRLQGR